MATATHSWSNQPTPPQGFSTPKTLVAPQMLPVPNQPPRGYGTAPTLVAPLAPPQSQPAPQPPFGAWPNQPAPQPNAAVWPNQPAPQQSQGSFSPQAVPQPSGWPNLRAPQQWSGALATVEAAPKPKRKGRGVVAWTLWVFAGGLFAGPQLADYADQGVEAGVAWLATLATSAPSFVRPYLPKPIEAPVPAAQRGRGEHLAAAVPSTVMPAVPAESTAQPPRKPEIAAQSAYGDEHVAAPSPKSVGVARPTKDARQHMRGTHGKATATLALAEAPAAVAAAKPTEPQHGAISDPFESGEGAGAPAKTRMAKAAAEPAAVKNQAAKSQGSLDNLMADEPSAGGNPHERRSASREIDTMLKDVQKSDPQVTPKRAEPASASPSLTAADIARVMGGVKSSAAECGRRFGQSGVADLKLTVGKDGTISGVAVRGKLADSPVGRCVVQAARDAVFPHNSGLTFDYRIDVR